MSVHQLISTLIITGLVLAVSPAGAAKKPSTGYGFYLDKPEVGMLKPEEFLIMPWGWTVGDEKALKDIKECGFNMAGFVRPEDVRLVGKVGLKCIVNDSNVSGFVRDTALSDAEIAKRVGDMTAKLKDNPAVFGYYILDEPTAPLFPNLARWADAIHKADPDALAYINLLPIGAQGPGSKDYEDYLEQFAKVIRPAYISYDHYTLMDDGSVRPSLWQNLEVVRKAALKHGIPFWNIILANAHFHYANPTQGGLNLQVYSTLAYGGRGISYFTYFAPLIGNYRNAAIDQFMNKTPTWDMIRLVNLQIHKLGPTYLQLKSVNVFHHPNVPGGCKGMDSSKYLAEVSGGDFLIGEFEGPNGVPFVMIANKDIHTSAAFGLKFKDQGKVMMTSAYTGETGPFGGENGWLAPGQGVLLSLEK